MVLLTQQRILSQLTVVGFSDRGEGKGEGSFGSYRTRGVGELGVLISSYLSLTRNRMRSELERIPYLCLSASNFSTISPIRTIPILRISSSRMVWFDSGLGNLSHAELLLYYY